MLRIISFIYLVAIIIVSLIPFTGTESVGHSDKIAHFIVYALLGILGYYISGSFKQRIYFFLSIISLGVVLELVQFLIPTREFSYLDIAANFTGTVFGFLVSWMIRTSRESPNFGGCGSPHTTVPVKHVEKDQPN